MNRKRCALDKKSRHFDHLDIDVAQAGLPIHAGEIAFVEVRGWKPVTAHAVALAPAQRGVHRPDSASLAGEVAAAIRTGDVIAVKGSLGSKMKIVVDAIVAASGGEAGR